MGEATIADDDLPALSVTKTDALVSDSGGDAYVEVIQKKDSVVVFADTVLPGEHFSFVGADNGTLSTEITIYVDGVESTRIHTSCSQPVGPGLVSGDFLVVAGWNGPQELQRRR